jgi:NAD(P)-binding Rossmann-like domain
VLGAERNKIARFDCRSFIHINSMAMGLFALLSMLLAATIAIAQENQVVFNGLWNVDQLVSTPRVAIVGNSRIAVPVLISGAGAGGASTAYHLARLAGNAGKNVSITIYEKSNYIGGRSTTVNVFDDERYPVELGASIFVPANRILMQAAEDFGLHTEEIMDGDEDSFGM